MHSRLMNAKLLDTESALGASRGAWSTRLGTPADDLVAAA
jgi:hypothetical protein